MTKASTKKGMAGKLLAAGCSLALAASLTPAAALTAFAAGETVSVTVVRESGSTAAATEIMSPQTVSLDNAKKITPVKNAQSTLFFTPNTTSTEEQGTWSIITAGKNQVAPFAEIFKNAKGAGVTAASYWQPGTKLEVTGATGGTVTLTYEQVQAATNFYPHTTEKAINTAGPVTVTPGIAMSATTANIVAGSSAQSISQAILNNGSLPTGTNKATVSNALSIGLSGADYDVANLAKNVNGVTTLKIILPAQEYKYVPRTYGENWNDTMNAVVNAAGFDSPQTNFVVASSNNYQDALTASGLAGALKCPLLLTDKDELTKQTADQITALADPTNGAKVYVIGGPLAVSENVKTKINQLTAIAGKVTNPVVRLAGETAAETSLKVYEQMAKISSADMEKVVVTTSIAFQDAMSISPYTYDQKIPVVLTGEGNVLDKSTLATLEKQTSASEALSEALILGGNLAVASSVENQLYDNGVVTVKRIGEETCWETSNAIAEYLTSAVADGGVAWSTEPSKATVATGDNYLDALVASQYCAKKSDQPLLLVGNGQGGDYCVTNFIDDTTDIITVNIVGGPQAVSSTIASQINKIVAPRNN